MPNGNGRNPDDDSIRERSRRVLFICNKTSGKAAEAKDEAVAHLSRHEHIMLTIADCPDRSRLSDFIIDQKKSCDLVVLGGGDGTLNAAARGLIAAQVPLGIIPLGTANDLARTLGIPEDLQQATDIIANGIERRIDLGEINGIPFFNVASIGLSTDLAMQLSSGIKKRFGKLGYVIAAVSAMFRARSFHATIESQAGTVDVRTFQIAVGNGLFYGGGMAIEQNAKIDDGTLDLYSLELGGAWKLALVAPSLRTGDHQAVPEIRAESGTCFKVRTRRRRPINADGEILAHTPAEFRILPRAIAVMTAVDAPGITGADGAAV